MAQVNLDNALESGRDAVRRHAWREAFELLTAADQAVAEPVQVVSVSWK